MKRRTIAIGVAIWVSSLAATASILYLPRQREPAPASSALDGQGSLFELSSRWTTDEGRTVRLADLRGKFALVALVFTRCGSVCPTLVNQIKAVERATPAPVLERARFLLVSIDPEHDTPERLREYRKRMGLAPERWTLLRGDAANVRELAAALGVSFGADLTHSKLVTLIDPLGRVVLQRSEIADDPGFLAASLRALSHEESRQP